MVKQLDPVIKRMTHSNVFAIMVAIINNCKTILQRIMNHAFAMITDNAINLII